MRDLHRSRISPPASARYPTILERHCHCLCRAVPRASGALKKWQSHSRRSATAACSIGTSFGSSMLPWCPHARLVVRGHAQDRPLSALSRHRVYPASRAGEARRVPVHLIATAACRGLTRSCPFPCGATRQRCRRGARSSRITMPKLPVATRIRATIFVPSITSPAKVDRIRAYGAEIVVSGDRYADALAISQQRIGETRALGGHAFDQTETLFGQGTVGLEIRGHAPDPDTFLLAAGA